MVLSVSQIYRYPVKSLSAEALDSVSLTPDQVLPNDRRFGIAHVSALFDPLAPEHLPKSNFLNLMRNERLALLSTSFDDSTNTLTIMRDGKQVARGQITTPVGRSIIEQFFASFAAGDVRGTPRLLDGRETTAFTDQESPLVSLIGHASIRDLERVAGEPVDHRRFRANFYFEGGSPWEEFGWAGQEISIGDVRLRVEKRIDRCAATNVHPEQGIRDMNLPLTLKKGFSHIDMGVYARVITSGSVSVGQSLTAPG
ncbi:MAG: MOSC domain-containing protein [Rhodospirillales bacterium]